MPVTTELVVELDEKDCESILSLVDELKGTVDKIDGDAVEVVEKACINRLPRHLIEGLVAYRRDGRTNGLLFVRGIPDSIVAFRVPTPTSIGTRPYPDVGDLLLLAVGSHLGTPFSWSSYQDGRLIQDIIPVAEFSNDQVSMSSTTELVLHVDAAFSMATPDYLGFIGIRPGAHPVPTYLSALCDVDLEGGWSSVLFRPTEARDCNRGEDADVTSEFMPVLYGNGAHPYMNFDPVYFEFPDPDVAVAVSELHNRLVSVRQEVCLSPGEMCFVDNRRVAHGRPAFTAALDGTDRYVRRACFAVSERHLAGTLEPTTLLLP